MTRADYDSFIADKILTAPMVGIEDPAPCHPSLFPHQRDVTRWNCRMGRSGNFIVAGGGKTRIALDTVRIILAACEPDASAIIVTPLAVGQQFVDEAAKMDIEIHRLQVLLKPGINVTNYQRLHRFTEQKRPAVMWLDESSILRAADGATRKMIIAFAAEIPFRYGGSATPAPNDHDELGSQSEYLGVKTHAVMRSEFFINAKGTSGTTQQGFRLKKNAVAHFWRWVASWSALIAHPRDLGYDTAGYDLPPLTYHDHVVDFGKDQAASCLAASSGSQFSLFPVATTRTEENRVRSATIESRCKVALEIAASYDEQMVIWGDLNAETEYCAAHIPGAKEVHGRMSTDEKEELLLGFTRGDFRILLTKPSLAGFGMNWQHCRRTVVLGATHKWEQVFQLIRRFWRFGQKREVHVHLISSAADGRIVENYQRKDRQAEEMVREMAALSRETMLEQLRGQKPQLTPYNPTVSMVVPAWIR